MMANPPSVHASFQPGAASDAAPVSMIKQTSNDPLPAGQSLMQVSSALGGILLLIFFMTWLIRRLGIAPAKSKNHRLLNVKASCSLGPKERVVVVEVEDNWLVLGVTSQQITMLHQMPAPSDNVDNVDKKRAPKSLPFGQMLKNTLQRKRKNDKDDDEK
ncbi:flagellar biosynthetic protein FliO [Xenorhabdus sp. DI]|uniref:flagellar biosynthetic protein FliO n=1 Tax=Xenorhabdus doucetiae TaxID=351671 RepID=UPI0019BCF8AF|nr:MULTISPECIES: flagellar biosynthetic protein FliO [unclassified Xenorhabdus]MBD2784841.1 flagellar biosynthetic protein FliO [Xenorhabdus sp. 3]MBD2787412.1 flagellar biosynthetic protein FliO [Xenorhabdus sp. DI]MBD2797031.1 flagellar biosynthetic protein FliO [Xenorhabdus sp. 18]